MSSRKVAMAVVAMIGLAAGRIEAATLNITSVTGNWGNVVASTGVGGAVQGGGSFRINWGVPTTGLGIDSSYAFKSTGPVAASSTSDFIVGEFVHGNGTIFTSSTKLKSADLTVRVAGSADGKAFSTTATYRFGHDETLNSASRCPAGTPQPCGDTVSIASLTGAPIVIRQANTVFTLLLDGFVAALGGPTVSSLLTPEQARKSLFLRAHLDVKTNPDTNPPAPVPLPGSLGLFVAGLALLGAGRLRR